MKINRDELSSSYRLKERKLNIAYPDGVLIKKFQALQIEVDRLTTTKQPELPSLIF